MISKIFPEIGRAETIHLVRKSSNSEPSSWFFGRLKIWTFGQTSNEVEIEDVIFSNTPLFSSNEMCFHKWNDHFCVRKLRLRNITHVPEILATRNTSYLTASKSLNDRKIARMAPILNIFGPNRSQRRDLFFEKFSNERRRHRGIVVVILTVVGRFGVASITGTLLLRARNTWFPVLVHELSIHPDR